jgi:hypothetical protein
MPTNSLAICQPGQATRGRTDMTTSNPGGDCTFVQADGVLAEVMCQVRLLELTVERARQLLYIHCEHHPDECMVHLEAAYLLLIEDAF